MSKTRSFHPQRSVFVNLAMEFQIWHLWGTPSCSRQWQAVPVPIFHFIWLSVKNELCLYLLWGVTPGSFWCLLRTSVISSDFSFTRPVSPPVSESWTNKVGSCLERWHGPRVPIMPLIIKTQWTACPEPGSSEALNGATMGSTDDEDAWDTIVACTDTNEECVVGESL